MDQNRVIPFYMAYPLPLQYQEDQVIKDLEYMQQIYPRDVMKYQRKVEQILNRLDYRDSIIYDEYPDRWTLYRISDEIVEMLKKDENKENLTLEGELEQQPMEEKWKWIGYIVQLLVISEIYKRRRRNNRGVLKF